MLILVKTCHKVESWAFESRIQLKELGIPLTIGIRNPSSTDKESPHPVPRIRHGVEAYME